MDPASLYGSPNALAPHYSRFRVSERLLLTGHSHQAWPDRGFEAQRRPGSTRRATWTTSGSTRSPRPSGCARASPGCWETRAAASRSRRTPTSWWCGCSRLCRSGTRPRLVTTDGEFHTIRRQLDRLAEEGVEVVRVPEAPLESLAARLARAVDDRTALVLVSAVFFDTGRIARGLGEVAASCRRHGARLLLDVYHALNVVPVSLAGEGLGDAFVVGGGYKYCQLGEGNCFLRMPPDTDLRPVVTGWFSEFTALADRQRPRSSGVWRGRRPVRRRDLRSDQPLPRGRRVRLLPGTGLTPALLREVSQHQIGVLASAFDALDLDPAAVSRDRGAAERGRRLSRAPITAATELGRRLRARGVLTDARGAVLRFGPAPYLSDRQLTDAMGLLGEVVRASTR